VSNQSAVITLGTDSFVPELVLGYQTQRSAGTLTHTIIGRADPDVTLKPVAPRTGTLELFVLSEDDAITLVALLEQQGVFRLDESVYVSMSMWFVVTGTLGIRVEEQTQRRWIVSCPYAEVSV
jgi:hypothetical protein